MGIYGTTVNLSSPFLRATTDDEKILSQAVQMRFRTRKGSLWRDRSYGFLPEDFLQDGIGPERLAQLQAEIENECKQDERVDSATATYKLGRVGASVTIDIEVLVAPKLIGPFRFVIPTIELSGEKLRKDL